MRHSTVSAPVQSCNVSNLSSPSLRFCCVHLLQGETLYFIVEQKSKVKELYNQICIYLASQGMRGTDLFGLAVILEGEYLYVDADIKLSKYAPKHWRSSSTHGLDGSSKPLLAFYLRVQFYVDSPLLLGDEVSRHHYYLQLRLNMVQRNTSQPSVAEEMVYSLVGLALQADFGDYVESQHGGKYFTLQDYFPQQMLARGHESNFYKNSILLHKAKCSLSRGQAETQFIRDASSRDLLSLAHNCHLYRLKRKKHDTKAPNVWLAICTRGIELYEERSNKAINGTFLWNNIGKLCFDRKKFEIRSLQAAQGRMVYYTNSDEKSKHLLSLCKLTHQFCMAAQPKLNEIAKKEEEERKQCRDLGNELGVKLASAINYSHDGDQRISVISTTSSNTTSGIVSDRVHSLDESEDDLEMEIMINSPPAISIESLAVAHLRDSFSEEKKKIGKKASHKALASSFNSTSDDVQRSASDSANCANKYSLYNSADATTDGSPCSSSCSTVVVTTTYDKAQGRKSSSVLPANRSQSTSSSLELEYSHTTQNSALSDSGSCCLELDYSVQSAHTSSGIYTMQSNCETNTVTTTALAGSSETSGLGQSIVEDSESIRSRSGSIVSASGSFHGDGSDPSDTGHGTPLTAKELSDLIVGKSSKPCRGQYPAVATVSESLDSVADYVTLPPPPIPPSGRLSFRAMEEARAFSSTQPPPPPPPAPAPSPPPASAVAHLSGLRPTAVSHKDHCQKYFSEEAMLQRQIQFQHLAAGYSSHPFRGTSASQQIANHSLSHVSTSATNEPPVPPVSSICSHLHLSGYLPSRYAQQPTGQSSCSNNALVTEEAAACIVTTAPQINILKSQSTYLPCSQLLPNYAIPASLVHPTHACRTARTSSSSSCPRFSDCSSPLKRDQYESNVAIVGSNNYLDVRKSGAAFLRQMHEKLVPLPAAALYNRQPPPLPPSVTAAVSPPPPPMLPPPPPPPPRNQYSMCPSTLLSQQMDQYRQQLYSDVDYVIYPMKDPAISRQEYLDSKEATEHCKMNSHYVSQTSLNTPNQLLHSQSCSMNSRKNHSLYCSTPNVAAIAGCSSTSYYPLSKIRYASNQNLTSDLFPSYSNSSLVYLSNLYSISPSLHSSSMQSLQQENNVYGSLVTPFSGCNFVRARSDDNLLNCAMGERSRTSNFASNYEKRLPPQPRPPPPPPLLPTSSPTYNSQMCSQNKLSHLPLELRTSAPTHDTTERPSPSKEVNGRNQFMSNISHGSLDISSLREQSKNFDLPLIAALCNDKSLLRQTNTIPPENCNDEKSTSTSSSLWASNDHKMVDLSQHQSKISAAIAVRLPTQPYKSNEIGTSSIRLLSSSTDTSDRNACIPNKIFDAPKMLNKAIRNAPRIISCSGSSNEINSTSKLKLMNAKLAKTASNTTNKLKYSIIEANQKQNAKFNEIKVNADLKKKQKLLSKGESMDISFIRR